MRKTESEAKRKKAKGEREREYARGREGAVENVAIMMINELHFSCDAMSTR